MRRKIEEKPSGSSDHAAKIKIDHHRVVAYSRINLLFSTISMLKNLYLFLYSENLDDTKLKISASTVFLGAIFTLFISLRKFEELVPEDFLPNSPKFEDFEFQKAFCLSIFFMVMLPMGINPCLDSGDMEITIATIPLGYLIPDILSEILSKRAKDEIFKQSQRYKVIATRFNDAFSRQHFGRNSLAKYFCIQYNSAGLIISPVSDVNYSGFFSKILHQHLKQLGFQFVLREGSERINLVGSVLAHDYFLSDDLIALLGLEDLIQRIHYAQEAINFIKSLGIQEALIALEKGDLVARGLSDEPIFPQLDGNIVKARAEDGTWSLCLSWHDKTLFEQLCRLRFEKTQVKSRGIFQAAAPALPFVGAVSQESRLREGPKLKTKKSSSAAVPVSGVLDLKPAVCFGEYGVYDPNQVDLKDPTQIQRLEFSGEGRKFVIYVRAADEIAKMFAPGAWENLQVTFKKGELERHLSLDIKGRRRCNSRTVWATVSKHQQRHIISTEAFELQFPPGTEPQARSFFVLLNDSVRADMLENSSKAAELPRLVVGYPEVSPVMRR